MIKITIVILFLLSINNAKANIIEGIKDITVGTIAGVTTSLVVNRLDLVYTRYHNALKAVGGLATALLTLRSFKERQDIKPIHGLVCILTTTILLNTNLWDNVFGDGYDSDDE